VIAYLDGTSFSGTAQVSNINGFSRIRMGAVTAGTMDIHIDDVAVNDTTGTVQTGLPGAGQRRAPAARLCGRQQPVGHDGGTAGAANNWGRVSETTPDDATTYNETALTGTTTIDDFNVGLDLPRWHHLPGHDHPRRRSEAGSGRRGDRGKHRLPDQVPGRGHRSRVRVGVGRVERVGDPQGGRPVRLPAHQLHRPAGRGRVDGALCWRPRRSATARTSPRSQPAGCRTLWALVETVPITTAALGIASETDAAQPLARTKTLALGVATETSTARGLSQPLAQLKDNFSDGTIDAAKWPNSFGTYSETGGRARVACNTGYNAVSSALMYTLHESSAYLRAYAPAGGGATTEAWSQVLIKSIVGGTDLGFELRMTTNQLSAFSRVGYVDAGEVTVTYSATDHAWLRVRETGGTTYWDTSPDGSTWANRRTLTSPAWVADVDLEFQLIAHRSDGTDDFAEFDNVNTGGAATAALTLAAETDTGQALARLKSQALALSSETNTAQSVGRSKAKTLGTATETGTAQALAGIKRRTLAPASSSEAAQLLAGSKRQTLSVVGTTEAAQPLTGRKTQALGATVEASTARAVTGSKTQALGTAGETATALSLAPSSGLQTAVEISTAQPLARSKRAALGTASESATARPLGSTKTRALLPGIESASSLSLGGGKARTLVPAVEAWTARLLPGTKVRALTPVGETDGARVLTGSMAGVLGAALEADAARPLSAAKRLALGVAVEISTARIGPYYRLGVAVETDQAVPLVGSRQRPADHLTVGTSGPTLAAGASGPGLSTSSSGPQLAASVTSGGG
jgi:hypothetical protein